MSSTEIECQAQRDMLLELLAMLTVAKVIRDKYLSNLKGHSQIEISAGKEVGSGCFWLLCRVFAGSEVALYESQGVRLEALVYRNSCHRSKCLQALQCFQPCILLACHMTHRPATTLAEDCSLNLTVGKIRSHGTVWGASGNPAFKYALHCLEVMDASKLDK